jgi:multiple sugar transport system substrate-binding protein
MATQNECDNRIKAISEKMDSEILKLNDEISKKAFEIYTQGYPANEFTGLPVAEELMRLYGEQFQKYLSGKISVTKLADNAQAAWLKKF